MGTFSSHDSVDQGSNPVGVTLWFEFYYSEWHERAVFLHLPKDTCVTAIGLPSRL